MVINEKDSEDMRSRGGASDPGISPVLRWKALFMRLAAGSWLLVAVIQPAHAQASPQAPPTCKAAEHRQFDFWLGTWDVQGRNGQPLGVNVITSELDGCVIREQWQSLRTAHRGSSYNIFDRRSDRWHQTWVDNSGLLLELNGGWRDSAMVLESRTRGPNGTEEVQRITWTPRPNGTLRQFWEQSQDGGRTWSVAFDGLYVRRR